MLRLRRQLSSLNHLFAVEAVGRLRSFTLAADELGITQPAISKAVRATEDALGFALFERERRGLRLTPKGQVFWAETRDMLLHMSGVVQDLTGKRQTNAVRVNFSSSFVALWLLPRLQEFRTLHPDVTLTLEEGYSDTIDLAARGIDFSARLGHGNWDDVQSSFLVRECVGAVASPAYLASHPDLHDPGVLAQADLIHVHEPQRVRIGWTDWFTERGARPPPQKPGLTVSDYHSAIDAALMGQGVALGWDHLVQGKVDEGLLAWVGPHRVETGKSIFLVEPRKVRHGDSASRFRSWILGQFVRRTSGV